MFIESHPLPITDEVDYSLRKTRVETPKTRKQVMKYRMNLITLMVSALNRTESLYSSASSTSSRTSSKDSEGTDSNSQENLKKHQLHPSYAL